MKVWDGAGEAEGAEAYAQFRHMARKQSDPSPPSFAAALDAKVRRQRYLETTLGGTSFSRLCRRRNQARAWLNERGFRTAELYETDFPLRRFMDAAGERTRFVIKPVSATNAWGVMGLEKLDVSRWRDVLTGQVHTVGDILILLDEPMQRYNFPDKWLLEELLTPPSGQAGVLEEFKVYGFRGRCPLVLQVRGMRDGRGYKWWTADWTPVTTGKYVDRTDPDLQPPECASELVALAEQVSSHIPASFCRIDMFVTDTGVRLSELTPEPGAYHDFSVETDRLLGVYWEQAETRLMTDMKPADLPWTPL